MKKLKLESADLTEQNIDKIAALFPNVLTETMDADGNIKKAINFSLLQQILQADLVEGDENYEFTWVGKKQSIIDGNKPIRKTLRPCPEDSKDWDKTENLYIEGDNLEVLKLLQGSYLNSIKLMYFDPPYNTGNDFVYRDNFTVSKDDYEEDSGVFDDEGNRLFQNSESNGRFHSDWCSMMHPRLQLARNLLTDDGVIFISIDDNEVHNLRKMCDEIFGEENFVNCIAVKMSEASGVKMNHQNRRFPKIKEYILFYKKGNFKKFTKIDKYQIEEWDKENNIFLAGLDKEDRNKMREVEEKEDLKSDDILLINSILKKVKKVPLSQELRNYSFSEEERKNWLFENSYRIIKTAGSESLAKKVKSLEYIPDAEIACSLSNDNILFYYITDFNRDTKTPRLQVIFADSNIFRNPCDFWQDIKTTGAIANEGDVKYSNGKKPLKLLERIISMTTSSNDIVLDFFSGSASTAHAVMNVNQNDSNKRRFIMVQLPEDLLESLSKATGKTKETIEETISFLKSINKPLFLSELGKERIRRAGKKITEEAGFNGQDLDIGFRVLKLDSTNMKDVYYGAGEYNQQMLLDLESNIKNDRTDLDLLYGVLLDWGVSLDLPHTNETIGGVKVHFVNGVDLVACFADNVTEKVIHEIAKRKPLRVVFRDSSFSNSPDKINVTEIFKTLSPETTVKVI